MDEVWNALFRSMPVSMLSLLGLLLVILAFFWAIIKIVVNSIEKQNDKAMQTVKEAYENTLKINAETINMLISKAEQKEKAVFE